jgi:23S rRNA (cytidine1920-2'-O)/16S rRNA (cytidine1409-2'-O)-methyltransferase
VELVHRGLVASRSAAQAAIAERRVRVEGVPIPRPATLVTPSTAVEILGSEAEWASRAGHKLAAALAAFEIAVAGKRALDVGASTGGFTDVLLHNGAAAVTALDVGYGQLLWRLRTDPRVTVIDRTNFRHVDPEMLGAPFDVVVVDVSFISVTLLARRLAACGTADTDYVILVKPQFEAGKGLVGRGGLVTDPAVHAEVLRATVAGLADSGLATIAVHRSPLAGTKGNREFLLHAILGAHSRVEEAEIEEVTGS